MVESIFKQIGNSINDSINTLKTELQSNIDAGVSNVISMPLVSGSSTITNGERDISISFNSQSLLSNGLIISFEINYNDGSEIETITAVNESGSSTHTFENDGIVDATLDISVVAIDDVGNKSRPSFHTLTYRDNVAPYGTIVPSYDGVFYEGATDVTFSGALDSDGTIVSYKVSNISLCGVTVSNSIVYAGSAHTFNVVSNTEGSFTYTVSAIDDDGIEGATLLVNSTVVTIITDGESVYTTPGIYEWLCPNGVTSINAVLVGGGGGANSTGGNGGCGGSLGWKNNIVVIPGQSYTVIVGKGGDGANGSMAVGESGGSSQIIINGYTYSAHGGDGGNGQSGMSQYGGKFINCDGGGNGGLNVDSTTGWAGGAGGYNGDGGGLTHIPSYIGEIIPSGGSAGGGCYVFNGSGAEGCSGAGVGIFGQGLNGINASNGGVGTRINPANISIGGSGGENGYGSTDSVSGADGGLYGGGGAWVANVHGGNGGNGAVRIIWGSGRSFPANAS